MNVPREDSAAAELVARAVAGDAIARQRIVEQLWRRVGAIALSILGNAEDAQDATQNTFIELFRALPTFRGNSLLPWADRIAARTAAKQARARRVRSARELNIDPDSMPHGPPRTPEHRVPRAIRDYLAELPETRRVALVLRHVLDYSIDEVAEITAVSPNTVKDRLLQARAQVRKTLRRELGLLHRSTKSAHD